MNSNTIITIDRQYASGGRIIGQKLAEELGIPFYDTELLKRAAEESGIHPDLFKNAEKRATSPFALSLSSSPYTMSLDDEVFVALCNTIKKIADEGAAVIVGACADYVLKDKKNCINVFIHAEMKDKIDRAINVYKMEEKNVQKTIERLDKCRSTYYVHYTDSKWGRAKDYDITLDSGIGINNAVKILKTFIDMKSKL